jgi:hypothetical protein
LAEGDNVPDNVPNVVIGKRGQCPRPLGFFAARRREALSEGKPLPSKDSPSPPVFYKHFKIPITKKSFLKGFLFF